MVTLFRREQPSAGAKSEPEIIEVPEDELINQVVRNRTVTAEFQPIVRIDTSESVGYEAYGRPPADSFANPGEMFKAAAGFNMTIELDHVIHAMAYRTALSAKLHPTQALFINADLTSLNKQVPADLVDSYALAMAKLKLFVDVSERDISRNPSAALAQLAKLRKANFGVSWDNAGTTQGSLALMPLIRPDVVKIDVSLIQNTDHPHAAPLVNAAYAYAESTGASIMAVGVENEEQVEVARGMGAVLAQGYHFGRPGPLGQADKPANAPIGLITHPPADNPMETPFSIFRQEVATMPASMTMLETFAHHLEQRCLSDPEPPVILLCAPKARMLSGAPLTQLSHIAANSGLTALLSVETPGKPIEGVRFSRPVDADPIIEEWAMAVVGPHFGALLTARTRGMGSEIMDLGLTYQRPTVLRAARVLLSRISSS